MQMLSKNFGLGRELTKKTQIKETFKETFKETYKKTFKETFKETFRETFKETFKEAFKATFKETFKEASSFMTVKFHWNTFLAVGVNESEKQILKLP
jgi:hypothetical protein